MSQSMKALQAMLTEGISLTEAARRFGISKATVSKAKLHPSIKRQMTQTIEQLTARVRELEEENARLKAAVESVAKRYESMLEKAKRFDAWKANPYTAVLFKQIAKLNNNLEVERMRLAACDVAATGYFDSCNDEYKSAALTSVLSLRERAAKLEEDLDLSITRDATINLLKQTLVKLFNGVASAPVASGVCCCGDDMTKHPSAFSCGHTPVDTWDNYLSGWREEIDKLVGGMSNVQLDSDSDNGRPVQLRELDSPVSVGQLLGDGQNPGASDSEPEGTVALTDTFQGNDSSLIDSIASLIELDRKGALVPHGIGGHARTLLESAAIRLGKAQGEEVAIVGELSEPTRSEVIRRGHPIGRFLYARVACSPQQVPNLCEGEGCPHHGTPHVCVSPKPEVFQPVIVWYYPDDGKVISASPDSLTKRQEALGKAVPINDYKLAVELTAQYIYSGWKDQEGYVPWVENGNSNKQDEARQFARIRLNNMVDWT